MPNDFKKGEVVQLKSGGPKMSVYFTKDNYGSPMVHCRWFDSDNKEHSSDFPPETLRRVA